MVIKAYEKQNSTVNSGSQPSFLRGARASIGAVVVIAVSPNSVVKWHSDLVPEGAQAQGELHPGSQQRSLC